MIEKSTYTTGELASKAGVSQRTVRYYEELGLIHPLDRLPGGRREFTEDALQRLRFISRLKKAGISLEEMQHLNQIFSIQQSTSVMLQEADYLLTGHLSRIAQQKKDLDQVEKEINAFKRQIHLRLQKLNTTKKAIAQSL
ncbi:MAG: MerR family transcriptional regulator [Leptonema sp. (in: Bacteria)]|nr:MerR family transcriptional regulator [Leptonema sp. (in: bacteria)]